MYIIELQFMQFTECLGSFRVYLPDYRRYITDYMLQNLLKLIIKDKMQC